MESYVNHCSTMTHRHCLTSLRKTLITHSGIKKVNPDVTHLFEKKTELKMQTY